MRTMFLRMMRTRPRKASVAAKVDDARWAAVQARDAKSDGTFVTAVTSTGIYCRPSCPARHPLRKNVRFYATPEDAEAAGFRPCKRCKPKAASLRDEHAAKVAEACRIIETAMEPLKLDELAAAVGLSTYHFHRLFKASTGVTPKTYAIAHRNNALRNKLQRSKSVTDAIYAAGFNSSGRFYANSTEMLGMTPSKFRKGGADEEIRYAFGESSLGQVLVATSGKGVCSILIGIAQDALTQELRDRFPRARLTVADAGFKKTVVKVIRLVEAPASNIDLPLDVRGTAFQHRVWKALREIPAGTTSTYTEIARRIGKPKAVRAVAGACAANPVAVAIPCHRVVRSDGYLAGYHWGVERKRELLRREGTGGAAADWPPHSEFTCSSSAGRRAGLRSAR
jgi:AraC family transcriptional regulator, regulatory protein of adaptative response / methylated-DNA-[protein]-cysteine methyltransferase